MNPFDRKLADEQLTLQKQAIEILQVNVGKLCNLTCSHCHVEAGPTKTKENMDEKTAAAVVRFMDQHKIQTLDLTGGAPEMNPHFRFLVEEAKKRSVHVIDRCNLTVLFEKGQEDLADFLSANDVEIVASLPCYSKENVDKQRGRGTFDDSIRALLKLNELGYGAVGSGKLLNLVYNPVGPHLPPEQASLEVQYHERLEEDFGIRFNHLYTITNMPITRYAMYLRVMRQYDAYVELLINSFNPATVSGLMCQNTLSVSWDGKLYDCDFNQMLDLEMRNKSSLTIFDVTQDDLSHQKIITGEHCFGCTAGAGSSCQGKIAEAVS